MDTDNFEATSARNVEMGVSGVRLGMSQFEPEAGAMTTFILPAEEMTTFDAKYETGSSNDKNSHPPD